MPCLPKGIKRYRRLYTKERKEHPWATRAQIRKIIRDHLKLKRFKQ